MGIMRAKDLVASSGQALSSPRVESIKFPFGPFLPSLRNSKGKTTITVLLFDLYQFTGSSEYLSILNGS